jgi:hypothetical protein
MLAKNQQFKNIILVAVIEALKKESSRLAMVHQML